MDSAGEQAVQGFEVPGLRLRGAFVLRRFSKQFAWPMLLLLLVAPRIPGVRAGDAQSLLFALGIVPVLCGAALRLWALGYSRLEGFVYDGPYRYVRNPVELGALLVYVGGGIILGTYWWMSLVAVFCCVTYLNFVAAAYEHERFKSEGAVFLRYAQRVRRWLPSGLPGANRSNRSYSLRVALLNDRASLLWLLGYGVVFAAKKH